MMLNLSYRTTPSSLSRQGWWHNEPSGNTCALQQKGMVIPQLIGGNLPTTSLMTVRWLHNTQYIMSWHVLTVAHIKSLDLDFSGRTTVTTSLFTSKITGIPSDSLSDSLSDSKRFQGTWCHERPGLPQRWGFDPPEATGPARRSSDLSSSKRRVCSLLPLYRMQHATSSILDIIEHYPIGSMVLVYMLT